MVDKYLIKNTKKKYFLSEEINQSLIRLGLVIVIFTYSTIHEYLTQKILFVSYSPLLISFLFMAAIECIWAVKCSRCPESSRQRIYFRIITNLLDNILLAIAIIYMGKSGTPLFIVYLWITFGIGIRYGGIYLIFSAILNIISFGTVIYFNPTWTNGDTLYVSVGILLSLIILPTYVYILIAKLSRALESEKIANQVKKSFLANMNHELRTPLNSILNLTELIRSYKLPEKIYSLLDMIRISTNAQLQIVNGILDISRIESGQYQLSKDNFDLYALVYEVQQIILPHANKKDIRFYIYIDPTCNRKLVGASDQIKQILINLTGNAVKFTDNGFVRITVNSGSLLSASQQIIFQVEDSGIGIAEQYQCEIFEPFTQADTSITRKYGGTGLGASISNELAKLMGGTLTLESKLNTGTVFTFEVYLGLTDLNQADLPHYLKIYPLNLDEEYSSVLKTYAKYGLKIAIPDLNDSERFKRECLDGKSILIVDYEQLSILPDKIKNLLDDPDVMMISANKKGGNDLNKFNSITSITSNATQKTLINVVRICAQFLPKNTNPAIKLPQTVRSLHILLAEDDHILREIYKLIFTSTGHKISLMKDGYEALDALKESNYDLVILDLHMPGLSGIEVATQIRLHKPNNPIRIILLTADSNNSQILLNNKSLFASVLVKPVDPEKLLDTVYKTLGLPILTICQYSKYSITDSQFNSKSIGTISDLSEGKITIENNIEIFGVTAFNNLLKIYEIETESLLIKLSSAEKDCDYSELYNILHKLRGTSLSIGAYKLGEEIDKLLGAESLMLSDADERCFHVKTLMKLYKDFICTSRNYLKDYYSIADIK